MMTTVKIQITPDELESQIKKSVKDVESEIREEVRKRAENMVPLKLQNATKIVLSGKRTGRRYGRGGKYIASAPGEAPAIRSNTLRLSHLPYQKTIETEKGMKTVSGVESKQRYAPTLEYGFDGMVRRKSRRRRMVKTKRGRKVKDIQASYHLKIERRPYVERTKKKALVSIKKEFRRSYL